MMVNNRSLLILLQFVWVNVMKPLRLTFLGLPLNAGTTIDSICQLIAKRDEASTITFINPQSWAMVRRRPDYLEDLKRIDYVLPDGAGVSKACNFVTRLACPRVSFDMSSLAGPFFEALCREKADVMLVGSKPGVTDQVARKLRQRYADIRITGCDDGYGPVEGKVAHILKRNPRVVIIGMGVPYQEKALLALREAGFRGIAITCGGFFDQYLQAEAYYPAWVDRFNLRFAYRIYKEPARLWRRYLIDYQVFIWRVFGVLTTRGDWQIDGPVPSPKI